MRRYWLLTAVLLWAADLQAAPMGTQGAMDDGARVFRQMLRRPAEFLTEYWYFFVGAVVVVLVLRAYLRK